MVNDHLISRSRFLDALVQEDCGKTDIIEVHKALEQAVVDNEEENDAEVH